MQAQNIPDKVKPVALTREWAEMIKLEHTVFALPFALSGLVLATPTLPSWSTVAFTVLAFIGARSAAMTLNRLIDARIDAINPRTKDRSIPAGRIKPVTAVLFTIASFALMLAAASQLPLICLQLSPIAVFWLSFYSFTKRFTWLCHLVLGIALGGAALGGWVAASGTIQGAAPWLLAFSVATWVAGFDIIYACQDAQFDSENKLHSIPARFGLTKALNISIGLHVFTVAGLVALGFFVQPPAGVFYFIGVALVTAMLVYEHSLVKPNDLSKVNAAFFTTNGIVSIVTFLTILLDRLL
ncbi:MAG: UbiA-like polyprenyltransferase [Candidatus Obscuribacterales bacterium]|jgi:4-hydroxybenzoate polyprenyltransferase